MDDDRKPNRPSLLLAGREKAHREHQHQHQIYHDKRQAATATTSATNSVVTEVVATISVVQQVNVDSNGSTIAMQTTLPTLTNPTPIANPSALLTAIVNSGLAATSTIIGEPPLPSAVPSHSFPPSQSIDSASTSALSTSSFASFVVTANSTNLILSSSSSTRFSNFSTSSTSSTSLSSYSTTSSTFLSSSSTESDSSTSSTSSSYSPTSSTVLVTSTAPAGVAGNAGTGAVPTSTSTSGNGGSNSSSTQSTPVIVGGVVGSIAGAAILIFLLMILIRWKKRHQSMQLLREDAPTSSSPTEGGLPPPEPSGAMVERRSRAFAMPAFPNIGGGFNRSSRQTERTISSAEGSEKGFYRVSGRKLPSVFQHGGDGYGGGLPDAHTLSGSSFYRDSEGFHGGLGSPTSPSAPRDRDSGIPVMRPSPARTPVTEHAFSYPAVPASLALPLRPDLVGRSHPSQDGSHASRFTEEV